MQNRFRSPMTAQPPNRPCQRHARNEPVVKPPDNAHETRTAPWKGARRARGGWRATSSGNIRTLLAPLPGRIPYRGWWGGPAPVVSPPAHFWRASGSRDEFQLDVRCWKPLCSGHELDCYEALLSSRCRGGVTRDRISNWSRNMASRYTAKSNRLVSRCDSIAVNPWNVTQCSDRAFGASA